MEKSDTIIATVQQVVRGGNHGPYVVTISDHLKGSITFSLDHSVWLEQAEPEPGTMVVLEDIRYKRAAGWRAHKARFVRPPAVEQREMSIRTRANIPGVMIWDPWSHDNFSVLFRSRYSEAIQRLRAKSDDPIDVDYSQVEAAIATIVSFFPELDGGTIQRQLRRRTQVTEKFGSKYSHPLLEAMINRDRGHQTKLIEVLYNWSTMHARSLELGRPLDAAIFRGDMKGSDSVRTVCSSGSGGLPTLDQIESRRDPGTVYTAHSNRRHI